MNISFLWNDFKGWQKQDYTWLMIASLSIIGITLLMDGSVISIISALANVVCVILVAQGKLSNYVWGTVGVVTYAYLAYTWGYFGETFLNAFYYLPMQFVGFYLWNKNQKDDSKTTSSSVVIRELSKIKKIIGVISIPVIIAIGAGILYLIGGKLVILDATTTVLSILAMVLMAMRMKEQWYLWIIVNMVSIYMWLSAYLLGNPDGIATLLMWIVFLLNSFYGLYKWREISYKI
jgi:nicotinamide mononucleotide transporter